MIPGQDHCPHPCRGGCREEWVCGSIAAEARADSRHEEDGHGDCGEQMAVDGRRTNLPGHEEQVDEIEKTGGRTDGGDRIDPYSSLEKMWVAGEDDADDGCEESADSEKAEVTPSAEESDVQEDQGGNGIEGETKAPWEALLGGVGGEVATAERVGCGSAVSVAIRWWRGCAWLSQRPPWGGRSGRIGSRRGWARRPRPDGRQRWQRAALRCWR